LNALIRVLHAFRDRIEFELSCERDDVARKGRIPDTLGDVRDERLVDFQNVQWEPLGLDGPERRSHRPLPQGRFALSRLSTAHRAMACVSASSSVRFVLVP
jgi:hypothetical protein